MLTNCQLNSLWHFDNLAHVLLIDIPRKQNNDSYIYQTWQKYVTFSSSQSVK
mgnify:CR=1 FL=1